MGDALPPVQRAACPAPQAEGDPDQADDHAVRAAVHPAEARHRAGAQAAGELARDGQEPARNGHQPAGPSDDGPGRAVQDAGGHQQQMAQAYGSAYSGTTGTKTTTTTTTKDTKKTKTPK